MKRYLYHTLNVLTFILVLTINTLANTLPINGKTTGAVSAEYDNFFTPAGFTFIIWSLIYLSLLVFVIYQFFPTKTDKANPISENISFLFVINGLANAAWIYAWHYMQFELTLVLMLILLWSLIRINLNISENSWWLKFPFQVYLGWICVATIANISVYLKSTGWDIPVQTEVMAGMIMATIAGILAIALVWKEFWIFSALAISWGLYGIYKKQVFLFPEGSSYQLLLMVIIPVILISLIVIPVVQKSRN